MILLLIPLLLALVLLLIVAIAVVVITLLLVAGAGVSVLVGGIAAIFRPTRWLAPLFLFILPLTAVGGVIGLFVLGGLLLVNASGALAFLGPIIGLLVGLAVGATAGTGLAVAAWSIIRANARTRAVRA